MVRSLGIRVSDERKGGRVKRGIRTEELGTTADGRRKRQFAPLAPSTYSLQIPTLIRGSVQHNSPRTCDEAQYNFPPRHSIDSPLAFGVVVSTHLTTETCSTIDFVSFGTSWSTPVSCSACRWDRRVGYAWHGDAWVGSSVTDVSSCRMVFVEETGRGASRESGRKKCQGGAFIRTYASV